MTALSLNRNTVTDRRSVGKRNKFTSKGWWKWQVDKCKGFVSRLVASLSGAVGKGKEETHMMVKDSAVGMSLLAAEFADCARLVAENSASGRPADMTALPKNNFVFSYLIGHALELTYKAILVEHGATEAHLKDIGHDLLQSREEADQCIRRRCGDIGARYYTGNRYTPFACLREKGI